ncbi:uncharacterized protein EI90DRAFT_3014579 [Cantharellus anzutake]|uniref:uncharacterized protein n=1 Tax=Cantharellus anzutake TaxID=1750568 RepID=UPI00190392A1|nr:uncharacterized protein EI90DRAFT_1334668 [Cantharellus anzutake]XP_038918529.1 uncharacterized protein EI90DRAFT_3014579 [Cantharellus anzutake]KAF8329692.1 hypothetical protein EI90DRAFT_1334668 [Cantharellus anzutake]KAF8335306.1 hypothetical protein EI90DRAFT_3014579 [Cantharellus anzutake]
MSSKVYVGNISWNTTDETLRAIFAEYGNVLDALVMKDRDTGRSRGYAFVTLSSDEEADAAINALNGQELDGRTIKVNKSQPKSSGGGFGGGGGGYGGGYSGGGGYQGGY